MKQRNLSPETIIVLAELANSGIEFVYCTVDGYVSFNPDKLVKFLECENNDERNAVILDVPVTKVTEYRKYRDSRQCEAITRKGRRCRHEVWPKIHCIDDYNGEKLYCHIHEDA